MYKTFSHHPEVEDLEGFHFWLGYQAGTASAQMRDWWAPTPVLDPRSLLLVNADESVSSPYKVDEY